MHTDGATPDIELMQRVMKDDREAFGELISRHQQFIVNFFMQRGVEHSEAEDMTQDLFIKVHKHRATYTPSAKFTTYLCTLAYHAWVDWLRKKTKRVFHHIDDMEDQVALAANTSAHDTERQMDLKKALAQLPPKHHAVVSLNVYQGLAYQDIADVLDIPLGTVKSRMNHALAKLKAILGSDHDNG